MSRTALQESRGQRQKLPTWHLDGIHTFYRLKSSYSLNHLPTKHNFHICFYCCVGTKTIWISDVSQCQALVPSVPLSRGWDRVVVEGESLANFILSTVGTGHPRQRVDLCFSGWSRKSYRPWSSIGSDGWSSWWEFQLPGLQMRELGPCIDGKGPPASNPSLGFCNITLFLSSKICCVLCIFWENFAGGRKIPLAIKKKQY